MKINIIGWYGKKNCGDESFKSFFNDVFREHELIYTTKEIDNSCDYYILGGGDVIKEYYVENIPQNKPIICIGVGLGYEAEANLLIGKEIISLNVRNKEDVEVFKKIGIPSNYTPDIVFNLKNSSIINKIESKKKKMAIILTDHVNPNVVNKNIKEIMYNEYFKWELAETLDLLSKYYQIYFISLSNYFYANDNKMSMDVQNRMEQGYKSILFEETESPEKLMDFLQQMDLVASMKFHGLIFSTICNVPFINIGITRKTNKFCEEMGLSDLSMNPKTFNKEDFLNKVKYVEDNTDSIIDRLSNVDKINKEILKNNIQEWKKMIK